MKKALFILSIAIASLSSQAAYLYWQVGDVEGLEDEVTGGALIAKDAAGNTYDVTSYFLYADPDTGETSWMAVDDTTVKTQSGITQYAADISDYASSGYSYYVELSNESGATVARSDSIGYGTYEYTSYTSAAESTTVLPSAASASIWHASGTGGYTPVPEPTSGLMLLLGAAMLGLKRKNRSIA